MRVNGEASDDLAVSSPPTSPQDVLLESNVVSSKQTAAQAAPEVAVESPKTAEQISPPPSDRSTPSSASAISSLIGGRNCVITTTIVTELTQTRVEPLHPNIHSSGEVKVTC